jgi:hypothetical protein
VDIKRNSRPLFYYVTDMSQGEYLNYTFEVSESGIYNVDFAIGAVSEGQEVRFYLEFDGKKTSNPRRYTAPYAQPRELATVTVPNIQLDKGKHTVTFYPSGNMNLDKFTFVLQGTDIQTPSATPLAIYPNPTGGMIYFESPSAGKLHITDLSGRVIYSGIVDYSRQSIDISGTAPGVYLITLQSEKESFQGKIYVK